MRSSIIIFSTIILSLQGKSSAISDVYLCDSKGGKKYHYSKTCRGLSACDHQIVKVSIEKAQKLGKTLCGWE